MGSIAVTGSVAYDTIMVFAGRFADHIISDQTHILNVSFLVDRIETRRGGTGANIAYNLALLGDRPLLCAAVGNDFDEYGAALRMAGVDTSPTLVCPEVRSATAFITTDSGDNQITAFYPGAMSRAGEVDLDRMTDLEHVVVAPDAASAMRRHVEQAVRAGARLVFAPAQQLGNLDDDTLVQGLDAAWLVVGNDYEFEVIHRRTGRDVQTLAASGVMVARTRGGEGSELRSGAEVHLVPVAAADSVTDPTGAGDAYLAGLLHGLREGRSLPEAGRIAALAATYVIEQPGPQTHHHIPAEFALRYRSAFGEPLD